MNRKQLLKEIEELASELHDKDKRLEGLEKILNDWQCTRTILDCAGVECSDGESLADQARQLIGERNSLYKLLIGIRKSLNSLHDSYSRTRNTSSTLKILKRNTSSTLKILISKINQHLENQ